MTTQNKDYFFYQVYLFRTPKAKTIKSKEISLDDQPKVNSIYTSFDWWKTSPPYSYLETCLWIHDKVSTYIIKHDCVMWPPLWKLSPDHTQGFYLKQPCTEKMKKTREWKQLYCFFLTWNHKAMYENMLFYKTCYICTTVHQKLCRRQHTEHSTILWHEVKQIYEPEN